MYISGREIKTHIFQCSNIYVCKCIHVCIKVAMTFFDWVIGTMIRFCVKAIDEMRYG